MINNKILLGRIANTILFYLGWLYAAYQAAAGNAWSGTFLILLITALHLYFVTDLKKEMLLIVILTLIGTIIDTLYSLTGFIRYHAGYQNFPWLAPPWISAMWMLFATTINHAFEWLQNRPILSALLGGCGGTLTYVAAIKYGSAEFLIDPFKGAIILAVIWAFLFPSILRLSLVIQRKV